MGRELSDVFKAKTRVGKRKVLDKFDISKEDKNKFLDGMEEVGGQGSGNNNAESILEYYRIDWQSVANDNLTQDFKTELESLPFAHYINDGYGQYVGISPSYSVDREGTILGVIYLKTFFVYYSAQHSGMKVAKANTLYDLLNIKFNGNADAIYKYFIPITAEEYWSGWDVANLD